MIDLLKLCLGSMPTSTRRGHEANKLAACRPIHKVFLGDFNYCAQVSSRHPADTDAGSIPRPFSGRIMVVRM
jgi:hypothetical protein